MIKFILDLLAPVFLHIIIILSELTFIIAL